MKRFLVLLALLSATSNFAYTQAAPTAGKLADIQVGATYSYVHSDYRPEAWHGYGFYADLNFRKHWGAEFAFHQSSGSGSILYERTYELGARYIYPIHNDRYLPYAKVMIGRGVFNFEGTNGTGPPVQVANLAYNTQSAGVGLDVSVLPGLNVRVLEYEYQNWSGFPPHGLTPTLLSFGVGTISTDQWVNNA